MALCRVGACACLWHVQDPCCPPPSQRVCSATSIEWRLAATPTDAALRSPVGSSGCCRVARLLQRPPASPFPPVCDEVFDRGPRLLLGGLGAATIISPDAGFLPLLVRPAAVSCSLSLAL